MPNDAETQRFIGELRADVRNLQDSNRQLWEAVDEFRKQVNTLTGALEKSSSLMAEAARNGSDWQATKSRGLLWLAGIGASGILTGLGLPKLWAALGKIFFFPA